jgi:hypothetical protein
MNKTEHLNFRITEEENMMFNKICRALIVDGEEFNQSLVFRRMIEDEYVMLRKKGLINGGVYD